MEKSPKPLPIVNEWARPFWEAARQHKLMIQECKDCGKHIFYPRMSCPECFSEHLDWVECSGHGTVYSFTVVESNPPSAFIPDLPYVVALIKLEEGVQMLSNIVEWEPGQLRCDMPVQVTFEKLNDEFTLPKFKPI
ncbi:MAG: uncharacterized protein QG577_1850 [Thermodesulfobacteriota bacterium]|nr:uncharacterized protein [Thermodesulfobacteriota bacterium]